MNIQNTQRLYFKKFSELNAQQKQSVVACWENPFCKRYNNIKNPQATVEQLAKLNEPTLKNIEDWWDTNFFRVAFLKNTDEFVGTFRVGVWYEKHDIKIWNYGMMFIDLKYWNQGFASEIIASLVESLKQFGVASLTAEASRENFGSYKTMIKNGFEFFGFDGPIDYAYKLDLNAPPKTKQQIQQNWKKHMDMAMRDLGAEKIKRLETINLEINHMIEQINSGANEKILVEQYFEKLNQIEQFLFN